MAAFTHAAPAASLSGPATASSESVFGRAIRAYRIWRDAAETRRQLDELTPRQLRDIGVDGDVDAFARRLAEQRHR